ncbi:MAG: HRDC domain-containing protein [Moraxella sp.]|nr:HRDC domain-containing protein [Moraxella sp.]
MSEQVFHHEDINHKAINHKAITSDGDEPEDAQNTIFEFPKQPLSANVRQLLNELPVKWVRTDDELYELIDEIDSVDRVALDTEFIKRSTYYPILALVQVNTGKAIYLVDAPRLDLTDFWQALVEIPEMIWYACGEDLGIFYLLTKCEPLTNVFDVQIGVAYLTAQLQAGYSRAVSEVLGVDLPKTESQSDWLVRPLSQTQENYAVDDVRYLLALADVVKTALEQNGTLTYAVEDSQSRAKQLHMVQNIADEQLYLDSLVPFYTHEQVTVLQALTAWRESLARSINQPKSFVIGKQAMREIVLDLPSTIKTLARTTINRGSLRMYGDEIIKVIKDARALPDSERPPMPKPAYTSGDKPFKNELRAITRAKADELGIPEMLLLKNRWLQALLLEVVHDCTGEFLPSEIDGYRKAWIVETVLPMLAEYKPHIQEMIFQFTKQP